MADSGNTQPNVGLISASDYKINSLIIVTSDGQSVDIKNIMLELNLYEDIFSPVMTGDITLGDAGDIISSYNLHGNEFIVMSIDKPGLNMPIQKVFRIYKIGDRRFGTASLQNYTMYFCSEELILSTQVLMSKSYKGLTIDKMVNDILVNKIQVNPVKMANGIFTPSTGSFDIIIPRMQPLEAISWLTPRAYNTNQNLYLFFENRDGFNFTSFENLLTQPIYSTYSRSVKITTDPSENFNSFNFISVMEDFDIIKSMRHGSFSSTVAIFDLVGRTYKAYNFNVQQVANNAMLNGNFAVNDLKTRLGYTLYNTTENMLKYIASVDTDPTANPANKQNWLPQFSTRIGQLNSFKVVISIPGDMLMKAGAVIKLFMPKMVVQNQGTANDPLRTGNYLVSGVHHRFMQDISTTILELLSDSISTKLPASSSSTQPVSQLIKL
jgi:hypothetical protein